MIGRFGTVDPLSDEFDQISPYAYALNNPLSMDDPSGMAADSVNVKPPEPKPIQLPEVNVTSTFTKAAGTILLGTAARTGSAWTIAGADPEPFTKAAITVGTALYTAYVIYDVIQDYNKTHTVNSEQKSSEDGDLPEGFKETKEFGRQHGQKVYQKGNKYYSRDVDGHNGGEWKVFEKQGGRLKRVGTADKNLNIFKK